MNTNGSEDIQCVWSLENKKGKPVSLHVGSKVSEHKVENLGPGAYLMFAHTTAIIPGGKHLYRYIALDMKVTSGSELLLHDVYKLHAKDNTLAIEFTVADGQTASMFAHFRMNAPVGPMKVIAKLFRNSNKSIVDSEFDINEETPYKTITTESIIHELKKTSEEKHKADHFGMIRPFLLISSMHPVARQQLADYLGMTLIGTPEFGNVQAETWKVISKNRKGLQGICSHMFETLNPAKRGNVNWYQCLYRVTTEMYKGQMTANDEKNNLHGDAMLQACKNSSDPTIADLEEKLLVNMSQTFLKGQQKDQLFQKKLDDLMQSSVVKETLFKNLNDAGLRGQEIHRFAVAFCLYLLKKRQDDDDSKEKFRNKEVDKEDKEIGKFHKQEEKHPEKVEGEKSYEMDKGHHAMSYAPFHYVQTDIQFIQAIKEQLIEDCWDPRNNAQKGAGAAKKVAMFVGKKYFKKYILVPLFPPLVLPYTIFGFVKKVVGSNHEKLYVAVAQIMLQRILLAVHGIDIKNYY